MPVSPKLPSESAPVIKSFAEVAAEPIGPIPAQRDTTTSITESIVKSVLKPTTRFSLICVNIKEATGSLLLDRQSHDKNEWFNLCK